MKSNFLILSLGAVLFAACGDDDESVPEVGHFGPSGEGPGETVSSPSPSASPSATPTPSVSPTPTPTTTPAPCVNKHGKVIKCPKKPK